MDTRHRYTWRWTPLVLVAALICSCTRGAQSPRDSSTTEGMEMEREGRPHHGIDYIEFTVTDMAESKRFYGAAFDWKFTDYGPEYAGIQGQGQGREVGGFRLDTSSSTGGPLVILYSDDLDLSVTKVGDAGGRIVKEPFGFPGGRRFHFQDPSGNELAVWSEQ